MFSKECTSCNKVKDLNDFSEQKKKPGKLYAWCDACRREAVQMRNNKPHREFRLEMDSMREKAMQLRRFNDAQVIEIRTAKQGGANVKDLAAKYDTSMSTIYKVINGEGLYGKVKS